MITDHPNAEQILTMTAGFVTAFDAAQAAYALTHEGSYFQGIYICDGKPNGATTVATDTNRKPSDQEASWKDFDSKLFPNNLKVPYQASCNVQSSPRGKGYELVLEVWYAGLDPDQFGNSGDHWRFRHYYGPDTPSGNLYVWHITPEDTGP